MPRLVSNLLLIAFLIAAASATATKSSAGELLAQSEAALEQPLERKKKVSDWFKKYDQIRRDAEMSLADRFQAMLMSAGEPNRRSVSFATRMLDKYRVALSEIKRLEPTTETRELQEGYTTYFAEATKLLETTLSEQNSSPLNSKSFLEVKKNLEDLDSKNKQIDAELRKEYDIPKHRHS